MKTIVLATHNRDKASEFRSLLSDLDVDIRTLDTFPSIGPIAENAHTLEGNALLKAQAVFNITGLPSLADDTGLEVHYLNDAPGVFSSRYAGERVTYAENVAKLLNDLKGVPPRRRAARFRCVIAFVAPGQVERIVEGICRGVIVEQPRGSHGFGYDPVFLPAGCSETFAEMNVTLKNTLSHRGNAFANILPILREYLKNASF